MLDFEKLNFAVKDALVNRGHSEKQIRSMSPREAFEEYCEWNGLINWGDTLWENAKSLMAQEPRVTAEMEEMEVTRPEGERIVFMHDGDRSVGIGGDHAELYVDFSGFDQEDAAIARADICEGVGKVLGDVWGNFRVESYTEEMARAADEAEARNLACELANDSPETKMTVSLRDVAAAASGLELRRLIQTAFDETNMPMSVSFDYLHYGAWADRARSSNLPALAVLCSAAWQRETAIDTFGDDSSMCDPGKLMENAEEIMRTYQSQWKAIGFFSGTIKARLEEKGLLESLGVRLGDYDEQTGTFYAEANQAALDRLKDFPADFGVSVHQANPEILMFERPREVAAPDATGRDTPSPQ